MAVLPVVAPLTPPLAGQLAEPTAKLLLRFDDEHNPAAKERLLLTLTDQDPEVGPALLRLAQSTINVDTRWMAMRGMATLHYIACAPFLEASLKASDKFVRANAARALGDLQIIDASAALLAMFAAEREQPAVEQSSLALRTLGVKAAAPSIREKIPRFTGQTRMWLIQALGWLGDTSDVPLLATYLSEMGCDTVLPEAIGQLAGVSFGPHPRSGPVGCPTPQTLAVRDWWNSHKGAWPRCDDCHPSATQSK
jgi:hypothetical protein